MENKYQAQLGLEVLSEELQTSLRAPSKNTEPLLHLPAAGMKIYLLVSVMYLDCFILLLLFLFVVVIHKGAL